MDYITQQIKQLKDVYSAQGKKRELLIMNQVQLDYHILFILGYLWNKNLRDLDSESKDYIYSKITKPTLGDLIDISRKLDVKKEFFGIKKVNTSLDDYPRVRNRFLGHGYTFEDGVDEYLSTLTALIADLLSTRNDKSNILNVPTDLVLVNGVDDGQYVGIRFDGTTPTWAPWTCSASSRSFETNNLYAVYGRYGYYRISPFVHFEFGTSVKSYIYASVQERLLGRAL